MVPVPHEGCQTIAIKLPRAGFVSCWLMLVNTEKSAAWLGGTAIRSKMTSLAMKAGSTSPEAVDRKRSAPPISS